MVTVTVITATTVIRNVIIGPSLPPGREIPRSANYRPWCVRDVSRVFCANFENIPFDLYPFGKPHFEIVGGARENIREFCANSCGARCKHMARIAPPSGMLCRALQVRARYRATAGVSASGGRLRSITADRSIIIAA
jgi:hypothetical protein